MSGANAAVQRAYDEFYADPAPLTTEQRKDITNALTSLVGVAHACATLVAAGTHDRPSISADLVAARAIIDRIGKKIEVTP